MLSVRENELLTRVGPGTGGGELMRRYWHPIAASQEFACVETLSGINRLLVGPKLLHLAGVEKLQLGDAYAVLARDDAAKRARKIHDPCDRSRCTLQHHVVVGIHRDVGMHVAIPGVHMQSNEDAPT